MVQSMPVPALTMIEPQLFLHLLVPLLSDPARLDGGHQLDQGGLSRMIGQVKLALIGAPLTNQPDLGPRQVATRAQSRSIGHADAHRGEVAPHSSLGSGALGHAPEGLLREGGDEVCRRAAFNRRNRVCGRTAAASDAVAAPETRRWDRHAGSTGSRRHRSGHAPPARLETPPPCHTPHPPTRIRTSPRRGAPGRSRPRRFATLVEPKPPGAPRRRSTGQDRWSTPPVNTSAGQDRSEPRPGLMLSKLGPGNWPSCPAGCNTGARRPPSARPSSSMACRRSPGRRPAHQPDGWLPQPEALPAANISRAPPTESFAVAARFPERRAPPSPRRSCARLDQANLARTTASSAVARHSAGDPEKAITSFRGRFPNP